jgi:hypothetical protein
MQGFSAILKKLPGVVTTVNGLVHDQLGSLKGSVLDAMAKRMPQKDAEQMLRHWSHLIHNEPLKVDLNNKQQQVETVPAIATAKLSPAILKSTDAFDKKSKFEIPENVMAVHLLHPIMGERLIDLGYKSVFLTSVQSLARAPIWEKQRILRPDRAARIAASKIQNGRADGIPGVITMYHNKLSGEVGIVDGQHRAGALLLLAQQGHWNEYARNIVVDVFTVDKEDDIAALFKEINSAEPVRLIDMPGEVSLLDPAQS